MKSNDKNSTSSGGNDCKYTGGTADTVSTANDDTCIATNNSESSFTGLRPRTMRISGSDTSLHHPAQHQQGEDSDNEEMTGSCEELFLPPPSWLLNCFQEEEGEGGPKELGHVHTENCIELSNSKDNSSVIVDNERENEEDSQMIIRPLVVVGDEPDTVEDTNIIKSCHTNQQSDQDDFAENSTDQKGKTISNNTTITETSDLESSKSDSDWKKILKKEICHILPLAAQELIRTSLSQTIYYARVAYSRREFKYPQNSDMGAASGYQFVHMCPEVTSSDSTAVSEDIKVRLPPFSSLPWIDRQLVKEWRTISYNTTSAMKYNNSPDNDDNDDDTDYELARILHPQPLTKTKFANSPKCYTCSRIFDVTLKRHHCRLCRKSFCHSHSYYSHSLPHLGYDPNVNERVCNSCKFLLEERNLAERVSWRMARIRDYSQGKLTPYFETGVDTVEDVALRIAQATIHMVKQIPLGAQAHVAVETVDVLRKHGLKGVYGIVLRKEFMAAADLLCKVTGINKKSWPLSVHELSAAIFYALAQHRAIRGGDPYREEWTHTLKIDDDNDNESNEKDHDTDDRMSIVLSNNDQIDGEGTESKGGDDTLKQHSRNNTTVTATVVDETDTYDPHEKSYADLLVLADLAVRNQQEVNIRNTNNNAESDDTKENDEEKFNDNHVQHIKQKEFELPTPISTPFTKTLSTSHSSNDNLLPPPPKNPVCKYVPNNTLSSVLFYAPLALNFIYCQNCVDIQLLAAQQNWFLVYAHLEQSSCEDKPASALFVHKQQKIACLAVRGTATIQDVVTDIRAMPVPFPEDFIDGNTDSNQNSTNSTSSSFDDSDWTTIGPFGSKSTSSNHKGGLALCGMARAAYNLYRENIDAIYALVKQGYRVRITGHSLGGGVAALLGMLVRQFLERIKDKTHHNHQHQNMSSLNPNLSDNEICILQNINMDDVVRVYTYGIPACVDAKLADISQDFCISVVLHDDIIPRLTPTSIRALLKHLLYIRKTWVKAHLSQDLNCVADRISKGWAPRVRGGFALHKKKKGAGVNLQKVSKKTGKWIKKKVRKMNKKLEEAVKTISEKTIATSGDNNKSSLEDSQDKSNEEQQLQNKGEAAVDDVFTGSEIHTNNNDHSIMAEETKIHQSDGQQDTLNDSDSDSTSSSDISQDEVDGEEPETYEGDYFYEALQYDEERLLEEEEDDNNFNDIEDNSDNIKEQEMDLQKSEIIKEVVQQEDENDSWGVPFDEPPMIPFDEPATSEIVTNNDITMLESANNSNDNVSTTSSSGEDEDKTSSNAPVILEETILPRMFIPGKIIHIYSYRGGYKAAFVPRTFRELRRISLAGNMLSDHTTKVYYEGLLEVKSIRKAQEDLPEWTSFAESVICSCCASPFTWASTSDTHAQEARDKHNCRNCGDLVCGPCSTQKIALSQKGIDIPQRVCDRCYNDLGRVLEEDQGEEFLTRSFVAEDEHEHEEVYPLGGNDRDDQEGICLSEDDRAVMKEDSKNKSQDQSIGERVYPIEQKEIKETKGEEAGKQKAIQRKRSSRNLVVNDLANRILSSSLTETTSSTKMEK